MKKQMAWLSVLVSILTVVFAVQYAQENMGALIFAGGGEGEFNDFRISLCADGKTMYGWGNKNLSLESIDYGCFNSQGSKIAGVENINDCRVAACRLGY